LIITINFGPKVRRIATAGLAIMILVILGYMFWPGGRAAPAVGRENRLVPIYYVQTDEPRVAISFDATWGADNTETLLDILDKRGIKTTFFLCGHWVEDYPQLVKEISDRGHELGNHTATHPHLNSLTEAEIRAELKQLEQMIAETGAEVSKLFRPPFGEYNNKVIKVADSLGYKSIQWNIDSLDWQELGDTAIYQRVIDQIHPGAIILFHNAGLNTAAALPAILDYLQEQGYQVVPISELIYHDNYYIDSNTGAQIYQPPPTEQEPEN